LTLISAPAGFGKTTLLSEWANQSELPIAWLSLEESDSDPDRFLAYLVAAVQKVAPGLNLGETTLSMRRSTQPAPVELALTALLNELVEYKTPFALVLDDYHTVNAEIVHDSLHYILSHLPAHIHLFIATRVEPPVGLSRLRARSELNEVRLEDLRFTSEEAQQFLEAAVAQSLSSDQIAALEARTEGWAAGLQLAALSLRGVDDHGRFIARLSGADRYIFDYLAEEVLSQQTQADQSFLMATSILDQLNGSLCNAVTGDDNGQLVLERLEATNLFILPLDSKRSWYRYHQLFSGFLRDRLAVLRAQEIPELHRRAAARFAADGFVSEAVGHYLAAGDHQQAADLIERQTRQLFVRGELFTLVRWIEAMPSEFVRTRPQLCLALAWGTVIGGRGGWEGVVELIASAAHSLGVGDVVEMLAGPVETETRLALCDLAILQGFLARQSGDFERAIALFEAVLAHRPQEDLLLGAMSAGGLGSLFLRMGDARRSELAFDEAVRSIRHSGGPFGLVLVLSMLAVTQAWQGRLNRAGQTFRQAMEAATDQRGRPLLFAGQAAVGLARVLLEQNELQPALELVSQGIRLSQQVKDQDGLLDGHITLARLQSAVGDHQGAFDALAAAEQVAIAMGESSCADRVVWWRVSLELANGDVASAAKWATTGGLETLASGETVSAYGELPSLYFAHLLFAQGRPGDALALIEPLLPAAVRDGRTHNLIELLAFQSVCLQALNRRERAVHTLARALLLAEPEGYIRIFVEEGPLMASLLRTAASLGHAPHYVDRLLAAFGQTPEETPLEPLSERELEVLRLMADGLTNPQIAETLTIALSTVKTHVNRIYGKLDVRSRTQAVARARKTRLID
jgi:LuxR family maltose regulon positive regulatory protein